LRNSPFLKRLKKYSDLKIVGLKASVIKVLRNTFDEISLKKEISSLLKGDLLENRTNFYLQAVSSSKHNERISFFFY